MTPTKPMMPFPEAIKSCLRQYVGFRGRATRAEYWWWVLGITVVSTILSIIEGIIFGFGGDSLERPSSLFQLAVLLPGLAVTVRRLHDIGRTGWWQLAWVAAGILATIPLIIGVVASLDGLIWLSSVERSFGSNSSVGINIWAFAPLIVGALISVAIWVGLAVWIIWWMVKQGQAGPNQHGPDPRALDTPV